MCQLEVVEKIQTHFMFNIFFVVVENGAVYEITCKNIVEP